MIGKTVCERCDGDGYVEYPCSKCKGTGAVWGKNGATMCCDGYNKVVCLKCGGTGEVDE